MECANEGALWAARESGDPDARLIKDFLATGDSKTFEKLVTGHLPWLKRLLAAVFNGDQDDMEDALQEILMGIAADVRKFRFQASFKTFFYRYARNQAIDLLRRLRRRKKHECQQNDMSAFRYDEIPETEHLRRERKQAVLDALRLLKREDRLLIVMKEVEGFSIEEIAAVTRLKNGTVKSRLHRTRAKLFKILTEEVRYG